MQDPLKKQLIKDIEKFREEKRVKESIKRKNLVRKLLYGLIGLSTIGSLIRILLILLAK